MTPHVRAFALMAGLLLPARLCEAQARFNPLLDSARLFGTPWRAETLVRADSTSADPLALVDIRDAALIAPGRIVFAGLTARPRQAALLSLVNGRLTVLANTEDDVTLPEGGKFRMRLYTRDEPHLVAGRGRVYLATLFGTWPVIYATDGERWSRVVGNNDSVDIGGGRRSRVAGARIIGMDDEGRAIIGTEAFANTDAILRHSDRGLEPLLVQGDTLRPGTTLWGLGMRYGYPLHQSQALFPTVLNSFMSVPGGRWSVIVPACCRGTEWLLMAPDERGRARAVLSTNDTVAGDTRDVDAVRAVPLSDGRFVVQTGREMLVVGNTGSWRVLVRHPDSLPGRPNDFILAGAERLSERELLLVLFHGGNRPNYSVLIHDGSALIPVSTDSTAAAELVRIREGMRQNRLPANARLRRVPGYDGQLVLRLVTGLSEFRNVSRGLDLFVDPVARQLRAMPRLPVEGREPIALSNIIGWNNENEAVAVVGSEIVLLRRN